MHAKLEKEKERYVARVWQILYQNLASLPTKKVYTQLSHNWIHMNRTQIMSKAAHHTPDSFCYNMMNSKWDAI